MNTELQIQAMLKKFDADKLYEMQMNAKLQKYGMCLENGKVTTIDKNLKPNV